MDTASPASVCPRYAGGIQGDHLEVGGKRIPVYGGDEYSIVDALGVSGADTVAVAATETLGPDGIRDLLWEMDPHDADLVVATGVVDVSAPRLDMRPVAGLPPLIHVEKPSYHGAKRSGKRVFDLAFALAALLLLAPVFALVAVAVKLDSRGPVFYRSERIGLDGKPFGMIKFRSMVTGADRQVAALMTSNEGAGLLFKMREDPPGYQGRKSTATLQYRRASAVPQRGSRRDERGGGAASTAAPGSRELRRTSPAEASRASGRHGPLAGQRALRSVVGRVRPPGSVVCRELVDGDRRPDHRADRQGGPRQ